MPPTLSPNIHIDNILLQAKQTKSSKLYIKAATAVCRSLLLNLHNHNLPLSLFLSISHLSVNTDRSFKASNLIWAPLLNHARSPHLRARYPQRGRPLHRKPSLARLVPERPASHLRIHNPPARVHKVLHHAVRSPPLRVLSLSARPSR